MFDRSIGARLRDDGLIKYSKGFPVEVIAGKLKAWISVNAGTVMDKSPWFFSEGPANRVVFDCRTLEIVYIR